MQHNIVKLPTEEAYWACNFNATCSPSCPKTLVEAGSSGSYEFSCDSLGAHFFACSVGDACAKGKQKVTIYVSEPEKTAALRTRGGISLEEFHRKYSLLFEGYARNHQALPSNNADQSILDGENVIAGSPESCSDWIMPSWNTDDNCKAVVYTDLGFIARVRPDPDFEASDRFYEKALALSPFMCGALAYQTELRVQQDRQADADALFQKACTSCGEQDSDFKEVLFAYQNKSWTVPACTGSEMSSPSGATRLAYPTAVQLLVVVASLLSARGSPTFY